MSNKMKYIIIFLSTTIFFSAFSQNEKKIQKSWIKSEVENLSQKNVEPDTLYTRYTFGKSKLYISFYPGWDDYEQDWSVRDDNLTIGFDTYHIETLNDTLLVIKLEGFRKMSFLSEDYLSSQDRNLDSAGLYNGRVLYKANKFITPRYSKNKSLRDVLQQNTERYNIRRAAYFLMTFVVTDEGKIENIKVINGITEGFDNEIVTQLKKTSKQWKPAKYKSMPVQTEMFYEIKYLDSIVR